MIAQDITIGCNPTNGAIKFFNVDKIENREVKVYDSTGRMVLQTEIKNDEVNLNALSSGVYFMHFGQNVVKKFTKK